MNRRIQLLTSLAFVGGCSTAPLDDPDAEYSADIGELGALYVNETAPPDGDGSALYPFQTIDDALAASPAQAWVILAPGTYRVAAAASVTTARIDGAGPELTTLTALDTLVVSGELEVGSLRLRETAQLASGTVTLTSVEIQGACALDAVDVLFEGGSVYQGTLSVNADTFTAADFDAQESDVFLTARVGTLSGFDARETPGPALNILGPGEWVIEDLEVTDVGQELTEPDGDAGVCLVIDSARTTIRDLALLRCAWRGVAARGSADVSIFDAVVAGAGNTAISSQNGARLTLEDVEVSDASVLLFANEASLEARQVLGERSRNAAVLTGANSNVTITESTFRENPNGHISILGPDTTATIRANTFDGTEFESCFAAASTDAPVEFSANMVRNCAGAGVAISNGVGFEIFDNEITNVFAVEPFPDLAEGVSTVRVIAEIHENSIQDVAGAGIAFLNSGGTISGNEIADTGDAGIRLVERGDERVLVVENQVVGSVGAGIAALTVDVTIVGNEVTSTGISFDEGLGDGILMASGTTAEVTENTISGSGYHGIRFVDGVTGSIDANTVRDSGLNAVHEDCGPFEPNNVVIGENDLDGDVSTCD